MQGFYFFVTFGLVLICIWKVCRKKSSSIVPCSIHYLHFSFEKHVPSQVLKDFSVENLQTTPGSIYLELLIIGIVLTITLYIKWGAFSLICFLSIFLFFLCFFFLLFLSVFSLTGNLSSNRFPKWIRNKGCFIFLQETEIGIDVLTYINIQWVFQIDIDYMRY